MWYFWSKEGWCEFFKIFYTVLEITHSTNSNCQGALCFCCVALCKDPIQIYISLVGAPYYEGNCCAPSRAKFGLNFMALVTVSTESALSEAGNSVLTASVFHRLAANFGLCAGVLRVTRHSTLTSLAQKFGTCT